MGQRRSDHGDRRETVASLLAVLRPDRGAHQPYDRLKAVRARAYPREAVCYPDATLSIDFDLARTILIDHDLLSVDGRNSASSRPETFSIGGDKRRFVDRNRRFRGRLDYLCVFDDR